jgi:hypothetical protein
VRPLRFSLKILTSDKFEKHFSKLREAVESVSAVEAAELFLSPHIREDVFLEALREPGPSLWIVNRSDVSDKTLSFLHKHPLEQISSRAAEKFKNRQATITQISEPILDSPFQEVEDFLVEDVLGHPLCSWEAMMYFTKSLNEDVRSSSCLSLTRRVWEHPKQSLDLPFIKEKLFVAFYPLAKEDPSPVVRAYAARIPIWEEKHVQDFAEMESNARVLSKWLQNEACSAELVNKVGSSTRGDAFLSRVVSLDSRLNHDLRKKLHSQTRDSFEKVIHEIYLGN